MLTPTSIGFLVYMLLMSVIATLLNGAIIIVYIRTFRSIASLYFITMLAFINFIMASCVMPFVIYTELNPTVQNSLVCGASFFLRHFLALLSIFVLLFIAYERLNVIKARTVKRLKIVEKSMIYNSRKLMLAATLFSFLFSAFCFYLYKRNENNVTGEDYNEANCLPEPFQVAKVYEFLTIGIGMCVYASMIYFYVQAYLIVYKSSRRCGILSYKHRNNNIETSHSEIHVNHNRQPKQNDKNFEMSHNENDDEAFSQNGVTENHHNTNIVKAQIFLISYSSNKAINAQNVTMNNKGRTNTKSQRSDRKDWHVAKIFILVFALEFYFFGRGGGGKE
jgi:hypothetical protein